MAKAVNQNDLVDIVRAQVESLGDIMTVVFKTLNSKTIKLDGDISKKMKGFQEQMDSVFGENGIMKIISSVNLEKFKPITIKQRWTVKKTVKRMINLMNSISEIMGQIKPDIAANVKKMELAMKPFQSALKSIRDIINLTKQFELKDIMTLWWKSKIISKVTGRVGKLMRSVNTAFGTIIFSPLTVMNLALMHKSLILLCDVLDTIRHTRTFLMRRKINKIRSLMRPLQRLINRIARMRKLKRALLKAMMLCAVVELIKMVVVSLIILAPMLTILAILSPVLIIGFLILIIVLKVMNLLFKFVGVRTVLGIIMMTLVIWALVLLGLGLVVLGLMAIPLLKLLPYIGLYFLGVIAIILIMALLGWVLSYIIPFLTPFVIAIGVLLIIVFAILLIGLMLAAIAEMTIDEEGVKANIKKIINCVLSIGWSLIEGGAEILGVKEDSNPIVKFVAGVVGTIFSYAGLLMAFTVLIVAVVVVVLLTLIASMLETIGKIELSPKAIQNTVKNIFDCCRYCLKACMGTSMDGVTPGNEDDQKQITSTKDFLSGIGIGIVSMIVQFIGFYIMFQYVQYVIMTMLLLLILTGIIWSISKISINPKDFQKTIKNVFDCCRACFLACMGYTTDGSAQDTSTGASAKEDEGKLTSAGEYVAKIFGGSFRLLVDILACVVVFVYVACLVLTMLLVLALAGILRGIQGIELDPVAINKTLKNVFDCCRACFLACMGYTTDGAQQDSSTGASAEGETGNHIGSVAEYLGEIVGGTFRLIVDIIAAVMVFVYVACMILVMLLVLALAGILRALQEIDLEYQTITDTVKQIFDTCAYINSKVAGTPFVESEKKSSSAWETIMDWGKSLFGPIVSIISAVMTFIFIALSIVNIFLVIVLANVLKLLNNVVLSKDTITNNVKTTIDTALYINHALATAKVEEPEEDEDDGLFGFLSDVIEGFGKALRYISNIAFIGLALGSIQMIMLLFKELKELNSVKLEKSRIQHNVNTVIDTASWLNSRLRSETMYRSDGKDKEYSLDKRGIHAFGRWVEEGYKPMVNHIHSLFVVLRNLSQYTMAEAMRKNIEVNVENIISLAFKIADHVTNKNFDSQKAFVNVALFDRLGIALNRFNNISDSGVENSKEMMENCIKLIDKIDGANFQKLDTAAQMFKAMAAFAMSIRGNFEGLAECINEDVMPTIEETKSVMENLPPALEDAKEKMCSAVREAGEQAGSAIATAVSNIQITSPTDTNTEQESLFPVNTDVTTPVGYDKWAGKQAEVNARYGGMQDILDVMLGAGGGVRVTEA